jgi:mono/diheme cytochrome c family protein
MKPMSETRALFVAVAISVAAITGTFGFAWLMRLPHGAVTFPQVLGAAQAASTPPITLSADALHGRHLFLMNCAHCHGDDARGDEGPDLHEVRKSDQRIHQLITSGVKGEMPSFARKLNDIDIRALTAYLRTLHS